MTALAFIAAGVALVAFFGSRWRAGRARRRCDAQALATDVGPLSVQELRQVALDPGLCVDLARARFQPKPGYPVGIALAYLSALVAAVAVVIAQATA